MLFRLPENINVVWWAGYPPKTAGFVAVTAEYIFRQPEIVFALLFSIVRRLLRLDCIKARNDSNFFCLLFQVA